MVLKREAMSVDHLDAEQSVRRRLQGKRHLVNAYKSIVAVKYLVFSCPDGDLKRAQEEQSEKRTEKGEGGKGRRRWGQVCVRGVLSVMHGRP